MKCSILIKPETVLVNQISVSVLSGEVHLMALLFLLTAVFPIQKQLNFGALDNYHLTVLTTRQVTFFWQPLANLQTRSAPYGYPLRTELDWESCALEMVIILSLSFLYFAWLERCETPV